MDGVTIMGNKNILCVTAMLFVGGCGVSPSDNDLNGLFGAHREDFEVVKNLCASHQEISYVDPKSVTRLGKSQSQLVDLEEISLVENIRKILLKLNAWNYHCSKSGPSIVVYSRGFVFSGEARGIAFFQPGGKWDRVVNDLIRTGEISPITDDGWYVFHWQN
ncbi:MAG TPA: hypothetical protein PKD17_11660 [Cellvibrionaceae bacterium]|nr:hypothetical protein [Cellvibrionaceae bacterium]